MDLKVIKDLYSLFHASSGISTDSRNIRENSIYFSLKGMNFNGNDFALEALDNGAIASVVDDKSLSNKSDNIYYVEDALKALQDLAVYHRDNLKIPVVGITGSNGKTTTKNLVKQVLSLKYNVIATEGNLNNHIGVPLSILSIADYHEIAVIEMGASAVGEINFLCNIAKPSIGLITNISNAHLEGFKSLEGVVRGKSELFDYLLKNNGEVIINNFDLIIKNFSKRFQDPICIEGDGSIVDVKLLESEPEIKFKIKGRVFKSQLFGTYNFQNILFALTLGKKFEIDEELSARSLENFNVDSNRSEKKYFGSNCLILDAYNANPISMQNAIDSFSKFERENKILILSDMNELGKDSVSEHIKVAKFIDTLNINISYLVGDKMKSAHGILSNSLWFKDTESLKSKLLDTQISNSDILVKGSRSFKLESLEETIKRISI